MVLAPHTDDGELGCGGSISRFREEGAEIFYTAFSVCEQSVPRGFSTDTLEHELMAATETLGIPKSNVIIYRYEVRRLPDFRQEILQNIIDVKKDVQPDLVFIPCVDDLHQDHRTVALEGLRAYKNTTILSYEMPWNNLTLSTSAFVRLEERHVAMKSEALSKYKTQAFRSYANDEFVRSLARTRGVQIGVKYAEAFELVRLVV
jgi:LmbE family N-acetylglucosaminyl deacetylase